MRFPGFEGEWTTVRLGDLVNIQSGFAFKSEGFTNSGIKLVIPKNFTKHGFGNFDHSISKFSNELPPPNYKCRAGDLLILLTDLTPSCELLGKPLLIKEEDGEVWLNQRIIRLDTNSTLSKRWLLYFLQTNGYHKVIKETATGSTVRHSSNKIINDMILSLPTIEEQEKISSVLQSIDDRILTQNKIIEELKLLKSTICNKLIEDNNGLPNKVYDIANIGRGRVISSREINNQNNPLYPVYSSQTSNDGIMGYLDQYDFDGEYITWTTDGANAGTVFYRNGKFNCTNVCGVLKIKNPSMYNSVFIALALQRQTKKFVSTNLANPKLMNNVMAGITLDLPEFEIQNKIARIILGIETKISNEIQYLGKLAKQKTYLLYKLFK